jgi:E3 ubiquitin-protein ligase RNF213
VGLAEHSPDMPLKVLHGILVSPPIAIIGLSNWVLDPAKMYVSQSF